MKVDIPKINIAEDKDYYSDWRDDLESLYKELDQGGGCFVDVDGTSVPEKIFGVILFMFDGDKRLIYERKERT